MLIILVVNLGIVVNTYIKEFVINELEKLAWNC
jgi:hypothetical protein